MQATDTADAAHPQRARLNARFAADAGVDVSLGCDSRPSWRGRVHLIALIVAAPCFAVLIIAAETTRARVGAALYAVGFCSMLTVSTTYHRWVHKLKARAAWRRADHATIFAAIAGSSTPIVLIVMPDAAGITLTALIWGVALIGAACKVGRWDGGDRVGSVLYSIVGLLAAVAFPSLWHRGGPLPAVLFVVAGATYTVGTIWFAKKWPRLRPNVFSYHEVWHTFTVVAAAANFLAVWAIAT